MTLHKLDEFKNLPWEKLDPDRCGYDWSFGRGGHGLENWTYTLSYYVENKDSKIDFLDQWEIWELPPALGAMLKLNNECGADEARRKMRVALGI